MGAYHKQGLAYDNTVAGTAFSATSINFGDTALANYKEGTWTPTITFGSAASGLTYDAAGTDGIYTRIGNRVWLDFVITLTAKGTSTGSLRVESFPFTVKDFASGTSVDFIGGNLSILNGGTIGNGAHCSALGGTTVGDCYDSSTGTAMDDTDLTDTSVIRGSVSYAI